MLAACLAMDVWSGYLKSSYSVQYGDNDSVRYAPIRGTGLGTVAGTVMKLHLRTEVDINSCIWFARVPTEANIIDVPSRGTTHPFLEVQFDVSSTAAVSLERFLMEVLAARQLKKQKREAQLTSPHVSKQWDERCACTKQHNHVMSLHSLKYHFDFFAPQKRKHLYWTAQGSTLNAQGLTGSSTKPDWWHGCRRDHWENKRGERW